MRVFRVLVLVLQLCNVAAQLVPTKTAVLDGFTVKTTQEFREQVDNQGNRVKDPTNTIVLRADARVRSLRNVALTFQTSLEGPDGHMHIVDGEFTAEDPVAVMQKLYLGAIPVISDSFSVSACRDRSPCRKPTVAGTDSSAPGGQPTGTNRRRLLQTGSSPIDTDELCKDSPLPECEELAFTACEAPAQGSGVGGEQVCRAPEGLEGLQQGIEDNFIDLADKVSKSGTGIAEVRDAQIAAANSINQTGDVIAGVIESNVVLDTLYEDTLSVLENLSSDINTSFLELSTFAEQLGIKNGDVTEAASEGLNVLLATRAALEASQSLDTETTNRMLEIIQRAIEASELNSKRLGNNEQTLLRVLAAASVLARQINELYLENDERSELAAKMAVAYDVVKAYGLQPFESDCDPPLRPRGSLPLNLGLDTEDPNGSGQGGPTLPPIDNDDTATKLPFASFGATYLINPGTNVPYLEDPDVVDGYPNPGSQAVLDAYAEATAPPGLTPQEAEFGHYVNVVQIRMFADNEYLLDQAGAFQTSEDLLDMVGPSGCEPRKNCQVWAVVERQRCLAKPTVYTGAIDIGIDRIEQEMQPYCAVDHGTDRAKWFSPDNIIESDGRPVSSNVSVTQPLSITGRRQLELLTSRRDFELLMRQTCGKVLELVPTVTTPQRWFAVQSSIMQEQVLTNPNDPQSGQTYFKPVSKVFQHLDFSGVSPVADRCATTPNLMIGQSSIGDGFGITFPKWLMIQLGWATQTLFTNVQVAWRLIRDGSVSRDATQIDLPYFVRSLGIMSTDDMVRQPAANVSEAGDTNGLIPGDSGLDPSFRSARTLREADLDAFPRGHEATSGDTDFSREERLLFALRNPAPCVQKCRVSTFIVTGFDMVPVYSLTFLGQSQRASLKLTMPDGTTVKSLVRSKKQTLPQGSALVSQVVVAGFLDAMVRDGGAPENDYVPPGGSPENFCFDTPVGKLTATRQTSRRCFNPDFIMRFQGADVDGDGIGDTDWQSLSDKALGLDDPQERDKFAQAYTNTHAYRGQDTVLFPAGDGPIPRTKFGSDEWRSQEQVRDISATCATPLLTYRRTLVEDTRPRSLAPSLASTTNDTAIGLDYLSTLKGGQYCEPRPGEQETSGDGFWCRVLENYRLEIVPGTSAGLDSSRTLELRQIEWVTTFTFDVPGSDVVLGPVVDPELNKRCPAADSVFVKTPSGGRASLVVIATEAQQRFVVVTKGLPPGNMTENDVGNMFVNTSCEQRIVQAAPSGGQDSRVVIPLEFCEMVNIELVLLSNLPEINATCWEWSGNLTELWLRTAPPGGANSLAKTTAPITYSGDLTVVPSENLTIPFVGNDTEPGTPSSSIPALVDVGTLSQTAFAQIQTGSNTMALVHLQGLRSTRSLVLEALQRRLSFEQSPSAGDQSARAELNQQLSKLAVESLDQLTQMQQGTSLVISNFASSVSELGQGDSSLGRTVEDFLGMELAQSKITESLIDSARKLQEKSLDVTQDMSEREKEHAKQLEEMRAQNASIDRIGAPLYMSPSTVNLTLQANASAFDAEYMEFTEETWEPWITLAEKGMDIAVEAWNFVEGLAEYLLWFVENWQSVMIFLVIGVVLVTTIICIIQKAV